MVVQKHCSKAMIIMYDEF